jgi:site-specific DNA-methyltransferase (adenine-specific)
MRTEPYLRDPYVTIYCGDALEVLRELPDSSVDACVTDPPYGVTSLEWDVPVEGWMWEVDRILKPTGSLWIFGSMRSLAPLVADAERGRLGPWRYAQEIVWEKHNGSNFMADRFRRVHELAAQFYRGEWRHVFKERVVTMDARKRTVRAKARPSHLGQIDATPYLSYDGGPRLQRSVIYARSEHGRALHPTQKPLGILRPLIQFSCPVGGTVLDPFAGSGSVGLAARELGCRSVLIELDEHYVEMAARRLSQQSLLL